MAARVRADEAYTRRMMGEWRRFKERQRERVICTEYGKELAKGSLVTHRQTQNRVAKGGLGSEEGGSDGGDEPRTYRMAFPARAGPRPCPVEGCSGQASTRTAMRVHFWHRHVRDTAVILEEGNLPHPRCPLCDMLVPCKAPNETHRSTSQCTRGAERKRRRLAAEEEKEVTTRVFSAYGRPPEMVNSFKYLGQVISAADVNWPAVVKNLAQERKVWIRMSHILRREGAAPRVSIYIFKAVVQAVLIFGSETWVVTPHMVKALGGFQTQVARLLTGRLLWRTPDGR